MCIRDRWYVCMNESFTNSPETSKTVLNDRDSKIKDCGILVHDILTLGATANEKCLDIWKFYATYMKLSLGKKHLPFRKDNLRKLHPNDNAQTRTSL